MHLTANRYQFRIVPLEEMRLPEYKGSTLRGGFGQAFKKVVCTFKGKECDDCLLKQRCVYSYVFETSPPDSSGQMTNYSRCPHPFIIEPPLDKKTGYAPGEALNFNLVLIGKANDYLPYFIYAFDELGKIGIGKGQAKYLLETVRLNGDTIYEGTQGVLKPSTRPVEPLSLHPGTPAAGSIIIRFLTPTRTVKDGSLDSAPDFQSLIRTLLHRISLLNHFHNDQQLVTDFSALIERAGMVKTMAKRIHWHDWERWSNRQDTRMKMGGIVGTMTFSGDLGEFMPYLRAGELLHVGKGTAFGLGLYEMKLMGGVGTPPVLAHTAFTRRVITCHPDGV